MRSPCQHLGGTSIGIMFGDAGGRRRHRSGTVGGMLADHYGIIATVYFLAATNVVAATCSSSSRRRRREGEAEIASKSYRAEDAVDFTRVRFSPPQMKSAQPSIPDGIRTDLDEIARIGLARHLTL